MKDTMELKGIRINFAIVLNADVDTIEQVQKYIEGLEGCKIVYQRADAGRLYIRKEAEA